MQVIVQSTRPLGTNTNQRELKQTVDLHTEDHCH